MRPIRFCKKTSDSPTGAAFELGLHQSVVPERAEKQSFTRAQRGQLGTFRLIESSAMVCDSIWDNNVFQRITRLRDVGRSGRPLWPGLRPGAGGGQSQPELFATLLVCLVGYGCGYGSGAGPWAAGADSSILFLFPWTGAPVGVNTACLCLSPWECVCLWAGLDWRVRVPPVGIQGEDGWRSADVGWPLAKDLAEDSDKDWDEDSDGCSDDGSDDDSDRTGMRMKARTATRMRRLGRGR